MFHESGHLGIAALASFRDHFQFAVYSVQRALQDEMAKFGFIKFHLFLLGQSYLQVVAVRVHCHLQV